VTGKTDLALHLAQKFNGELISADSRQVYQGMDIGTGKINIKYQISKIKIKKFRKKWIVNNVPIHLFDICKPSDQFSVYDFVNLAKKIIGKIWEEGKLPIVVGGTGFYIKALIDGVETLSIPPDSLLRNRLEQELKKAGVEKLYQKFLKLDSKRAQSMNQSDRANPRRLIRAIEIALANQKLKIKNQKLGRESFDCDVLLVGLTAPKTYLFQKTDQWVEEQIKSGLAREVESLLSQGFREAEPLQGLIYKNAVEFVDGKVDENQWRNLLKLEIHHYVCRQLTWFKKDKRIKWFDISQTQWQKKVENQVKTWLNG